MDRIHCGHGDFDRVQSTLFENYEPGATVGRIGNSSHVSQLFQLVNENPRALFAHLGLVGKICKAGSFRRNALQHSALCERPVVEAGILDRFEHAVLGVAIGDE